MFSVLLVDDNPDLLDVARRYLSRLPDLRLSTARSGSEALRLVGEQQFDVVVSDYHMPDMDGLKLVTELRERDRDLPIMLLTGQGSEEIAIGALNQGVTRYFRKGGNPLQLFGEMSQSIAQAAAKRQIDRSLSDHPKRLRRIQAQVRDDTRGEGQVNRLLAEGVAEGFAGRCKKEIEAYRQALDLDPMAADVWFNLGIALHHLGEQAESVEAFHKAASIDPWLVGAQCSKVATDAVKRLLITGVGGASGQVLAKFFHNQGLYHVVGVDANTDAPGQVLCDTFVQVPYADDPAYLDRMEAVCREHAIEALFSTVDEELVLIAGAEARLGCRVILSSPEAIESCLDKYRCLTTLEEAGVPAARTVLIGGAGGLDAVDSFALPFVVKPRRGRGSRGVTIVRSGRDLSAIFETTRGLDDYIVQEYLPGVEYTVDVLLDNNGRYMGSVPRERLLTDSGVSTVGRTVADADLEQVARQAAELFGLRYIVNVQLRRDADGNPKVIEINPRPAGTLALSIASSVGMPELALAFAEGRAPECPGGMLFTPGIRMYRFWEERFVPEEK
jgi:carbamoyl-phosphate synthase large subunit